MEAAFASANAPPVLTRDLLKRYARSFNGRRDVSSSTLTYWVRQTIDKQRLVPVQRGLYLNHFRTRKGTLADACFWYYPDAVVSLNTVLADAGVLNNPTRVVNAVVPIDRNANPPTRLGRKKTKAGDIHFYGMPRRIIDAGDPNDRRDENGYEHLRATPEKAVIDWLYLGLSPRSKRTVPPRGDIDLDMLNHAQLRRLARAARLFAELEDWLR